MPDGESPDSLSGKHKHQIFPLIIAYDGHLLDTCIVFILKRHIAPCIAALPSLKILGYYKEAYFFCLFVNLLGSGTLGGRELSFSKESADVHGKNPVIGLRYLTAHVTAPKLE